MYVHVRACVCIMYIKEKPSKGHCRSSRPLISLIPSYTQSEQEINDYKNQNGEWERNVNR